MIMNQYPMVTSLKKSVYLIIYNNKLFLVNLCLVQSTIWLFTPKANICPSNFTQGPCSGRQKESSPKHHFLVFLS